MKFSAKARKLVVVALSTMMVVMILALLVVPKARAAYWRACPPGGAHCETEWVPDGCGRETRHSARCCTFLVGYIDCGWKNWYECLVNPEGPDPCMYQYTETWCSMVGCTP